MRGGGGDALKTPVEIPWPQPLVPVRIVRRVNRFVVEAVGDDDPAPQPPAPAGNAAGPGEGLPAGPRAGSGGRADRTLRLHLPNSGRMGELLVPGARGRARLWPPGLERRTHGELLLVRYGPRWVSVDARMPNRLFAACLEARALPPFEAAVGWKPEVRWGSGRLDFMVDMPGSAPPWLIETKSCNLVDDGVALFPDAPTVRGARHLRELAEAVTGGRYRAAVIWFVQRDDARQLQPHRQADPDFARALAEAVAAGVTALAYRCLVTEDGIRVLDTIPVVAGQVGE